jgi:mannose-1-phosphate guanylyltransferase/mannose-6-phosphate isomerase
MKPIHPIILCGGGGTRLWPRSRRERPKPFLPLVGQRTLFQMTCDRVSDAETFALPIVVAGEAHCNFVLEQAERIDRLIVEPEGRNTAPAIALAALSLSPEALMLVCPSDHYIADVGAFAGAVRDAAGLAAEGWLVAFAISPTRPETGYGYLRGGEPVGAGRRIAEFVEKPDAERAAAFLQDGNHAWNAGIFAFTAGAFLDELRRYRPELVRLAEASLASGSFEGDEVRPDGTHFCRIEGESVDYAVMENTDRAVMVETAMGWSDVGNWKAIQEARERDGSGNCLSGDGELVNCRNVLVDSDGPRVSVIGLENVAIVVDGDEILVTTLDGAQAVGGLEGARNQ